MVSKQKAREVMLRWIEAVNSKDTTAFDQLADEVYTPGFVWHFPGVTDMPPGPAGMKQLFRNILTGNPNYKAALVDLFMEGDKAASRYTMRRSDPASGKPQHGTILDIGRFVGDKLAEEWELVSQWEDD